MYVGKNIYEQDTERCGGSMIALQTAEAVILGSNPASLTVENSECRQSHNAYCVNLGPERGTSPWQNKVSR